MNTGTFNSNEKCFDTREDLVILPNLFIIWSFQLEANFDNKYEI